MATTARDAARNPARTYGGRSAADRDDARRERLRSAALQIIGTDGYPAMTIPGVCAAAKVSTRHFYGLYGTKEDVFVDLYDSLTAESYARVRASLSQSAGQPMRERIPAAVLAYLAPMLADVRVARIAFVEIMGASARIERIRLDYRDTLVDLVTVEAKAAVRAGEVADRDWRFATLALVGAATAVIYDWMLRTGRRKVADIEAALTGLAVDLLTSDTTRGLS